MDERTKKVLIKAAQEIGVELLKLIGVKIGQVANELQRKKDEFPSKWMDKEKNTYRPFGTYDDFAEKRNIPHYEIKDLKKKNDNEV